MGAVMMHSRVFLGLMAILVVLLLALLPVAGSSYHVSLGLNVLMWVTLAESWLLFSGYTGYISLGHGAFFGVGAYFMATAYRTLSLPVIILLAGAVSALLALIIGFPVLRVRGPYFAILTLGLSEFAKYVFVNYEVNLRGTVGRLLFGPPSLETLYYIVLGVSIAVICTAFVIKTSRFGMGLVSIREDEEAAQAAGVNVALFKWLIFGISAFFPGLIGATMALRWTYIDPSIVFNPMVSFQITVMAFLGGTRAICGPIAGACILALLSEALWARYPNHYPILLGLLLIGVVMFIPEGLAGIGSRLKPGVVRFKLVMARSRLRY